MNTSEFLQQLRMRDIRVWADGGRLRVNAPQNVLTVELEAELAARKPEVLRFLESATAKRSSLVPINPRGTRPTFYGVPGPDGDVFCYLMLAQHLGPDQPFYAFEPPGTDGTEPPVTSIEALAARYLSDLRAFQPAGPYFIGGFCLGGIVAFELARQLQAVGQEAALLALFESPSPNGLKLCRRPSARLRCRRDAIAERIRTLAGQSWPERLAFVRSRLAPLRRGHAPAGTEPARGRQQELKDRMFRATLQAAYDYVLEARVYPGRIVLFLGSRELSRRNRYLRQFDWGRAAGRGLEVNVGLDSCTDYLMMLRDPAHVRALAERLTPYIDPGAHRPTRHE